MPRLDHFPTASREPFLTSQGSRRRHHLEPQWIASPSSYFNPTRAHFEVQKPQSADSHQVDGSPKQKIPGIEYQWRSRDNRKGRHTIIVDSAAAKAAGITPPEVTSSAGQTLKRIGRMFTYYPVWDVSYWVAQTFTWGSVVFVFNGLCYLLPLAAPSTEFSGEANAAGITSFLGCVLYQLGVIAMMFEAWNENRTGCFGWALGEAFDDAGEHLEGAHELLLELMPSYETCTHHHAARGGITATANSSSTKKKSASSPSSGSPSPASASADSSAQGWVWFPSWHDLRTHYFRELGFLGAFGYFVAATVFWILGFAALPGISEHLSTGAEIGVSKVPALVGSVGFVVASYLLVLETQKTWYTPAWHVLGWWCNIINLVGSIGFLLSAIFAFCIDGSYTCEYQSDLSTTWGSGLFLVGSVILWYESVNKYSVEEKSNKNS